MGSTVDRSGCRATGQVADELTAGEVVYLIGWLADNAPADLLIPPRFAGPVRRFREMYDRSRYTIAVPLSRTDPAAGSAPESGATP